MPARSPFAAALVALFLVGAASAAEPKAAEPKKEKPKASAPGGFGDFSLTSAKEPIEVTSERLEFDYKDQKAIFRGGVHVVQGDIELGSDLLTVKYAEAGEEQQLREVTAEGNVRIQQGARKATGKRAVFDQSNRTLVLTGDAILEEGVNQVAGDTIVVYPDESRMEVRGQNRRVKVILFPKKDEKAASSVTPAAKEEQRTAETNAGQ